jgi:signal transduction histidine kinase
MNHANFMLVVILALSVVLQITAATMSIRMIPRSGAIIAWILLACGFVLQGVRRAISLFYVLNGQLQGEMTVAVLGLGISMFMLLGIWKFRPLFDQINQTHRTLLDKQEKLAAANRELDAFVSTVSHDLRTPLTIIGGYSEHLQKRCENTRDPELLQGLGVIETQADRMTALLEDLLTLARVGYVERPAEPVDVNRVLVDVLGELSGPLLDKGVTVEHDDLPTLYIPESLLAVIFKNLIGNALQYACENGRAIEVGGEKKGDLVCIYVRDHGPGIPKEERERVFDIFYRGRERKLTKGTGIGLALVKKITELYGGRCWVDETPRGGCTFWVEINNAGSSKQTRTDCLSVAGILGGFPPGLYWNGRGGASSS